MTITIVSERKRDAGENSDGIGSRGFKVTYAIYNACCGSSSNCGSTCSTQYKFSIFNFSHSGLVTRISYGGLCSCYSLGSFIMGRCIFSTTQYIGKSRSCERERLFRTGSFRSNVNFIEEETLVTSTMGEFQPSGRSSIFDMEGNIAPLLGSQCLADDFVAEVGAILRNLSGTADCYFDSCAAFTAPRSCLESEGTFYRSRSKFGERFSSETCRPCLDSKANATSGFVNFT